MPEGWHLEDEPDLTPDPATEDQQWWVVLRSEAQQSRDQAADDGQDTADLDALIAELDEQITKSGVRGKRCCRTVPPAATGPPAAARTLPTCPAARSIPARWARPHRAGRHDVPPLDVRHADLSVPLRPGRPPRRTRGPGLLRLRPGRLRDALSFAALFDRFIQNLRRYLGHDVQYFAAVEPQRRLAPHIHIAIRGTIARAELRKVLAATYHQVWWPDTGVTYHDGDQLPVWHDQTGGYVDPATGEVLPTWDEALDAIGPYDLPWHVARFGDRFDAQGMLAGSPRAARCIGYLTKYLTKHVGACHQAATGPESTTPPGWPRRCATSRAPRGARTGSGTASSRRTPGLGWPPAPARARLTTLITWAMPGGGCSVSRKWSGKTLADHRADRKEWLLRTLGVSATDPARYAWELVAPADQDHMDHARRMLHVVADRLRWQTALAEARRRAAMPPDGDLLAAGRAA